MLPPFDREAADEEAMKKVTAFFGGRYNKIMTGLVRLRDRERLSNSEMFKAMEYVGVVGYEAGALLRFIDRRLGDSHD